MALTLLDIVKTLGPGRGRSGNGSCWISSRTCLTDTAAIARLIEPAVKELGFELVRVAMIGGKSDPTLQVMAERPDTRQLHIDDCADLSRKLSDILDEADPIEEAYRLEVSSPGIDRPLTRRADYADWAGHEARIRFEQPVDGAKQVSGIIEGIDGDTIRVATTMGERTVDFANIASAKLVLTDKLINATAPLSTDGAEEIFETEED
ncbi:ribosome maturation protein RimP [Sphingomonas rhizophila]|uniref:Ribosome maturation factor RimP n=1 Tax=Sphingomonas rhizophila TaxID=2071607 RepID=A0A7G9SC53_9SPHN|nr:ribosome maturation protein RimP [Sphingomonas rhizophila]